MLVADYIIKDGSYGNAFVNDTIIVERKTEDAAIAYYYYDIKTGKRKSLSSRTKTKR